jgi:hypothetical protein
MPTADELLKTNAVHDNMAKAWDWARALRNSQLNTVGDRKDWLVQGNAEDDTDFEARAKLADFAPDLPAVAQRVIGAVYKRSPRREVPEKLAGFSRACTRSGWTIDRLAREATEAALWGRWCLALLDRRRAPEDGIAVTAADDKAMGLDQPYVVLYEPEAVLDWRLDPDGLLEYVKLVGPEYREGASTVTEVREVDRMGIVVHRIVEADGGAKTVQTGLPVAHGPGILAAHRLPVVVCQYDPINAIEARSPFAEALTAELRAFRLLSDICWDVYQTGHPWLLAYIRGELAKLEPGATKYLKLDPGRGTDLPAEKVEWLEIQGQAIELAVEQYRAAKREVWDKVGVSGGARRASPEAGDSPSGVSVAWQFETDEAQTLASVAAMAEHFERDILVLAALDLGAASTWEDALAAITVAYHKDDFGLQSAERALSRANGLRGLYGPESTLTKEAMKRAARAAVPNLDEKLYAAIDAEIDKGGSYVPPAPEFGYTD